MGGKVISGRMCLKSISTSSRSSREVFGAIGAEAREDMLRDRVGAAWISELLATTGSWERVSALGLVRSLYGDDLIVCFGGFCGDSDTLAGGVDDV